MTSQNRVIICTGPPGNGRDEILFDLKKKINFNYFHMFEYIVNEARRERTNLNKFNILDFYDSQPEKMEAFHKAAVERIVSEINNKKGVNVVSTPLHFEWKGNRFRGLHVKEVEELEPEQFIIIFDDILRVRKRLGQDPQWRDHKFTLGEIANWRREEISGVSELAEHFAPKKEIQLVAFEHGPEIIKDLIFNRNKEKIYLSHPITGEGDDFFSKVDRFAYSLSEYYVVFDPYMIKDWNIVEAWRKMQNESIEKGLEVPSKISISINYKGGPILEEISSSEIESAIKNMRFQVIDTDYKIIENSSFVVVYHPRESISAGVMCEMVYAKSLAKMVYAYYPFEPSPFFEWYATRIFQKEKELREFLISESKLTGQTPLDVYTSNN
jgi:adenylate kinase